MYKSDLRKTADLLAFIRKQREKQKERVRQTEEESKFCMPDFSERVVDGINCILEEYAKERMTDLEILEKYHRKLKRQRQLAIAILEW